MDFDSGTLERASDLEKDPKGVVRRWLLELKLADKREADWRKKSEKILGKYRQKDAKKHSFNILWANTETLRPAVYNSVPSPDVRRRYKDADPVGKACSEVIGRCLEYSLDTTDFDAVIKHVVLDMLLPGRGVARVRYVPSFQQTGEGPKDQDAGQEADDAFEGMDEELAWEQTTLEHVQWDDFRISAGKEWGEVTWIAFRHRLTRDELVEKFGEIGQQVNLDNADDDDVKQEKDERVQDSFKTAEVWEIWDKEESSVLFISGGYKESPLDAVDDPLQLQEFFPIPRPLYAIEDAASLVPVPLYELYREQADELDAISNRINRLVKGLKLRGIYDSTLSELSELMRGEDNDLIPAANVTALLERGGLEKAIWFMPIDQAAMVLKELYVQREQCKQVIYEVTGISDILRGSTNAAETATAQQIKSQWGSNRLKRLQADVQRFIRDALRIQGEIIGERFQPETLATMTGLKFPTGQEKQQAMMQYQQQAMMAQQQGQQAPQPPQMPPSWDEILQVIRDDKWRSFKIDVETDSTIAASVETDMQAMQQLLQGVVQLVQGFGPAVQMGAMPVEAVKEIILAVTRRAKLGNAVEDALDGIKQPQQQQQQDNSLQVEQMRQQAEAQKQQAEQQHSAQIEAAKQQLEATKLQHAERLETIRAQSQAMIEQAKMESEADLKWRIAQLDAETKVIVAQIAAAQKAQSDQMSAQQAQMQADRDAMNEATERDSQAQEKAEGESKYSDMQATIAAALQGFQQAVERLSQPRTVVRGADGRIAGVQ